MPFNSVSEHLTRILQTYLKVMGSTHGLMRLMRFFLTVGRKVIKTERNCLHYCYVYCIESILNGHKEIKTEPNIHMVCNVSLVSLHFVFILLLPIEAFRSVLSQRKTNTYSLYWYESQKYIDTKNRRSDSKLHNAKFNDK